jgi:hypothetical protein
MSRGSGVMIAFYLEMRSQGKTDKFEKGEYGNLGPLHNGDYK